MLSGRKIEAGKRYFAALSKAAARSGSSYGSSEEYWDDVRRNLPPFPPEWAENLTPLDRLLRAFWRMPGEEREEFLDLIGRKQL